jgi:hypothetical protein
MENQMRYVAFFLLFISIEIQKVFSQCTPPMAEVCEDVQILCSLDELNGYACNNPSVIPSPCSPLCSQGGVGHNTSWWGFVSSGGNAVITLKIGNCIVNRGLEFGIWGDCVCGEEVVCRSEPCIPSNSINTVNVNLVPCKTYYLWVDGCGGDICDFTLNTKGDSSSTLAPLPYINNDTDKIIEVCEGLCDGRFFINDQPGGCQPTYVWTLDGDEVGGHSNEVFLDFFDEGDFIICITAYIGNPQSGSICSQEGPECSTIKVRKPKINIKPRTICWETYKQGRDSFCIYPPGGPYRCVYVDSNCCVTIDSGDFTVLDIPEPADVYYITCDNEPYIDMFGRHHAPCKNRFQINLPKTTDPFRCDSSITLTAVNVEFEPRWRVQCYGGQVEISPNITIIKPCSVGETYQFDYRWYSKANPGVTISTDERLLVDAISEDYCLEVNVRVELETEFALCAKTFCETYNEGDFAPGSYPINGDSVCCINGSGTYELDTFINWHRPPIFNWYVDGGILTSKAGDDIANVNWSLLAGDTGRVCLSLIFDCGTSPEYCIDVYFANVSAGKDFRQKGLIAKLNAASTYGGTWRQISGTGGAFLENVSNAKSRVRVNNYGVYYFEWSVNVTECISKDTVCVEFYKIKVAEPDYPKEIFEDRNDISDFEECNVEFYTPNMISTESRTYFYANADVQGSLKYEWYDIHGRPIINNIISEVKANQHYELVSPDRQGYYILLIGTNHQREVKRVCVF